MFPPFDGWKDITVHCTNPGGGGLAPQPQGDPDLPRPHAEWQGELTIADSAGADKSCPRKGQVFFAATRAEPGDFNYRISCSNGAFFTGTATAYDQGSGIFEAYGAHDISVSRTRSIQCTLQELQPAPVTVATDREDFTCNNPAIDPDADDLTADPRPNPVKPSRPLVVIDPAPKCGPNQKLVRGHCVRNPVIVAACGKNEQRANGKCVKRPGRQHPLPARLRAGRQEVRAQAADQHPVQDRLPTRGQDLRAQTRGDHPLQAGLQAGGQDLRPQASHLDGLRRRREAGARELREDQAGDRQGQALRSPGARPQPQSGKGIQAAAGSQEAQRLAELSR